MNRTSQSPFAYFAVTLATLLLLTTTHAVEPGQEILLWPDGAPGSEGKTGETVVRIAERGELVLSNIHKPNITPYQRA